MFYAQFLAVAVFTVSYWLVSPLSAASPQDDCGQTADQAKTKQQDAYGWKSLFDGKSLKGWKSADFGGEGVVEAKDGAIVLGCGESLTGIVYQGKPPRMDFEISLEAMRLDGSDFFATTTFPIGKEYCSLVVGGWGGTVVGISNVDFYDASENITTNFIGLESKKWYRVRIRVSRARIEAWIGKEQVVDLPTEGHKFGTRFEVDSCKPLGIASFCTTAKLRDIRIRRLKPAEVAEAAKKREND